MNILERLKILFTGSIYLSILTFNRPLQPQLMRSYNPVKVKFDQTSKEKQDNMHKALKNIRNWRNK